MEFAEALGGTNLDVHGVLQKAVFGVEGESLYLMDGILPPEEEKVGDDNLRLMDTQHIAVFADYQIVHDQSKPKAGQEAGHTLVENVIKDRNGKDEKYTDDEV